MPDRATPRRRGILWACSDPSGSRDRTTRSTRLSRAVRRAHERLCERAPHARHDIRLPRRPNAGRRVGVRFGSGRSQTHSDASGVTNEESAGRRAVNSHGRRSGEEMALTRAAGPLALPADQRAGTAAEVQVAQVLLEERVEDVVNLTQQTVATLLGVRQPLVNRLLKRCAGAWTVQVSYGAGCRSSARTYSPR